jgi:hypothetical protein
MEDVRSAVMFAVSIGVLGTIVVAQGTPVPQPFPGSGSTSRPAQPPSAPAPQTPAPQTQAPQPVAQPPVTPPPTASTPRASSPQPQGAIANVPLYPTAEYLETIDAGAGQHYVLYGTNLPFIELLAFYRTTLKTGGRELVKTPATYQFDLGRFQDDRMAYPPSVVIKDYTWNNSPGYLFVAGTTEKRYKTIIQIVAPGPVP